MSKNLETTAEGQAILQQRIVAAQTLAGTGVNAHQALNSCQLINSKIKQNRAHYDKSGQTMPTTVAILIMDAARNANHSRTLARNINKATGTPRPQDVAAHHIVARVDYRAHEGRKYLYGWGIAINDIDNGLYLPRYAHSIVPSLPKAVVHQTLHTDIYYLAVNTRLAQIDPTKPDQGRKELRAIKKDLLNGSFPH